jgi:putative addiction module antidote
MEVERKIRKIGNSLGVILPSEFLKSMGIKEDDSVFISYENNQIVIKKYGEVMKEDVFKEKVIQIIDEYLNK